MCPPTHLQTTFNIQIHGAGDNGVVWCLKVKVLGYSLHPVILLSIAQFTPDHWACSFLIPSQLLREHTAWLLIDAYNWSTDNALTALTVPCFTSLVWRVSGNWLAKGPHYDRFSQDSNLRSSDHWYSTLADSATVAHLQCESSTKTFYRPSVFVSFCTYK